MFRHLLLSEQREQRGRQLLCRPGRQLIAVFAKARDRRQCRGKSRHQHKRTDDRGADHCYAPDVDPVLSECLSSVAFVGQTQTRVPQMMPGCANKRSQAARCPAAHERPLLLRCTARTCWLALSTTRKMRILPCRLSWEQRSENGK